MAKEDPRRCSRCDFAWFAERVDLTGMKPRWFDEQGAVWTDGKARMARRASNYELAVAKRDRWARCASCGSTKVKTVSPRGFTPSALVGTTPAAHQPPSPSVLPPAAPPARGLRCACSAVVPLGQRFCGSCGTAMPELVDEAAARPGSAPHGGPVSDGGRAGIPADAPAWLAHERALTAARAAGDRAEVKRLKAKEAERVRTLGFRALSAEARQRVAFKNANG